MATIKVLAGDFVEGSNGSFGWDSFELRTKVFDFNRETIPSKNIETIDIASEENVKRIGGTVGWGITGGVLLGPLGLLAGLLMGGKGKDVVFVTKFKDGRKLLASCDSKTYTKIQASVFSGSRKENVSPFEPIAKTSIQYTSSTSDSIEKLIQLGNMFNSGLITESEFNEYKKGLEKPIDTITDTFDNHIDTSDPTKNNQTEEYNETTHHVSISNKRFSNATTKKHKVEKEESTITVLLKKIEQDGYTFLSPITVQENSTKNNFFAKQGYKKIELMSEGKVVKTYTL